MKPVVIIGLAVVCSVIGVFGLLTGIEMYEAYQYEKSLKFGLEVDNSYQKYHDEVKKCIPNDHTCFYHISNRFDRSVEILSENYGIDPNGARSQELSNLGKNFLQIEYDYLNELYKINKEMSYNYGYGNSAQSDLAKYWERQYEISIANMQIEMAREKQNQIDEE